MTLQEVKNYLHVDYTDDDVDIERMMKAAEYYLFDKTNKVIKYSDIEMDLNMSNILYNNFNTSEEPLAELYVATMVSELYNNKSLTVEKAQKTNYIFNCILNQLRYS